MNKDHDFEFNINFIFHGYVFDAYDKVIVSLTIVFLSVMEIVLMFWLSIKQLRGTMWLGSCVVTHFSNSISQ